MYILSLLILSYSILGYSIQFYCKDKCKRFLEISQNEKISDN